MCFIQDKQQLIWHLDICSHLETVFVDSFSKLLDAMFEKKKMVIKMLNFAHR